RWAVGRSAGVRRARTVALLLRREGDWGRAISVADRPADRQSRSHLRRRFLQPARPGISILRNHAGGRREERTVKPLLALACVFVVAQSFAQVPTADVLG